MNELTNTALRRVAYDMDFAARYDKDTNEWLDPKCCGPCIYCSVRPERHGMPRCEAVQIPNATGEQVL